MLGAGDTRVSDRALPLGAHRLPKWLGDCWMWGVRTREVSRISGLDTWVGGDIIHWYKWGTRSISREKLWAYWLLDVCENLKWHCAGCWIWESKLLRRSEPETYIFGNCWGTDNGTEATRGDETSQWEEGGEMGEEGPGLNIFFKKLNNYLLFMVIGNKF